jgi:hypothetical protein
MTDSGKAGLITVLVEEAIGSGVPVIVIDVKGDLTNLLLTARDFGSGSLQPWAEATGEADSAASLRVGSDDHCGGGKEAHRCSTESPLFNRSPSRSAGIAPAVVKLAMPHKNRRRDRRCFSFCMCAPPATDVPLVGRR